MSEYVLKIKDETQAKTLLTYLRSLDFVELLPRKASPLTKQESGDEMTSFLLTLPDQADYTQEKVNRSINEIRSDR